MEFWALEYYRTLFFLLSIAFVGLSLQAVTRGSMQLYGFEVILPEHLQFKEPLRCYYKGMRLLPVEEKGATFILPDEKEVAVFSLVISTHITPNFEGRRLKGFKRIPAKPFKWYDITGVSHEVDGKITWEWIVVPQEEKDLPEELPDHTIIVCFPSDYFLPMTSTAPEERTETHIIKKLPPLALTTDITQSQLDAAQDGAYLLSTDLECFHKRVGIADLIRQGHTLPRKNTATVSAAAAVASAA